MVRYRTTESYDWHSPVFVWEGTSLKRIRSIYVGDRQVYPEKGYRYKLQFIQTINEAYSNFKYRTQEYYFGHNMNVLNHIVVTVRMTIEADWPIYYEPKQFNRDRTYTVHFGMVGTETVHALDHGTEAIIVPPCSATYEGRGRLSRTTSHTFPYQDFGHKGRCKFTYSVSGHHKVITADNETKMLGFDGQDYSCQLFSCVDGSLHSAYNPHSLLSEVPYRPYSTSEDAFWNQAGTSYQDIFNSYSGSVNVPEFSYYTAGGVAHHDFKMLQIGLFDSSIGDRRYYQPSGIGTDYSTLWDITNTFMLVYNNNPQFASKLEYGRYLWKNEEQPQYWPTTEE